MFVLKALGVQTKMKKDAKDAPEEAKKEDAAFLKAVAFAFGAPDSDAAEREFEQLRVTEFSLSACAEYARLFQELLGFNGAALADFDEEDIRKLFLAGIEIAGGVSKLVKKDTRKDKTHEVAMAALIKRAREHEQKKRDVAGFEPGPPAAETPVVGSVRRGMASLGIERHSGVSEGQKPPSDDREASEPRQGRQPHCYRCGEKGHKMVDCHMTEDEARQRRRGDGLRSRALESGTKELRSVPIFTRQTG